MNNSLVSIIVPLYNSAEYIAKCLESCFSQTYKNIEIIVVDDGSTDAGLSVVNGLVDNDKRLKVIHKENGGVSSARNMGLSHAKGDYICFIDADDYLEKEFVKALIKYMRDNDADFCLSKNVHNTNKNFGTGGRLISSSEAEAALLGPKINVGCWNKMYRRSLLEEIKFDENLFYGEGLKFIIEVAHSAGRIVLCEDALYHYRRVNPNSATTRFDLKKMVNGEKSLFEIEKIIENDDRHVKKAWKKHYCLFCINAMFGALGIGEKNEYKIWRKKFLKVVNAEMLVNDSAKINIKIFLALVLPKLLASIMFLHEKMRKR